MSDFDECVASGQSCSYRPHGPDGEMQCEYCGKPAPQDGILPIETVRYHVMVACRDNWNAIELVRVIERAVVEELLNGGGQHQVPVTTYLAPDGVTRWPAYSQEQRQEYAAAAVLMARETAAKT